METKIKIQTSGILSIAQFKFEPANTLEYISSGRALAEAYIEITEIDDSGSVNNLIVKNLSNHYVFFMDGDILSDIQPPIGADRAPSRVISIRRVPNVLAELPRISET